MSENIPTRKISDVKVLVKDEVHLELTGPKRHWFKQIFYKVQSVKHTKIVLLRNPFSVIRSMHQYYLSVGSHHHWNMGEAKNREQFLSTYEKYFDVANKPNFEALLMTSFFAIKRIKKIYCLESE